MEIPVYPVALEGPRSPGDWMAFLFWDAMATVAANAAGESSYS